MAFVLMVLRGWLWFWLVCVWLVTPYVNHYIGALWRLVHVLHLFVTVQMNLPSYLSIDCGKHEPEMKKEMEKEIVALMSEELSLQEAVANETLQRSAELLRTAWKKKQKNVLQEWKLVKKQVRGLKGNLQKSSRLQKYGRDELESSVGKK
ncbi:hypothetical protein ACLB2K_064559 [Fragaria x ananassa]